MEPKNVPEQIPTRLILSTEMRPDGSKVPDTPVSESRNKSAVLLLPKHSIYCDSSSDGSSSDGASSDAASSDDNGNTDSSDSSSGSTAGKKGSDYAESVGSCSVESVGSCSVESESSDATSGVAKVPK